MSKVYVVLGGQPGDGGYYRAFGPKDALARHFAYSDGVTIKEVKESMRRFERANKLPRLNFKKTGEKEWSYGDYVVREK